MDELVDVPVQTDGCQGIPDSLLEYEGYEQRRARLLGLLCQLRTAAFDLHIAGFLEELGRLQERVNADQFKVLVIGNFKTGKSTFINALLGADILYTAPPATAFVTEIKFGCPPRALLHYKKEHMNGHDGPRQISIEDLHEEIRIKDYEQDLAQQECRYDLAEVFYEVDLCRHGVTLIDSPGLNEAESRAKITLDYLPDVDAAVFLTSSNAALGMQEVSALQHVTSLHSAVFLVCNHFDAVRAKERPALVNYVFGVLAKHTILPKDRVFFTSALRALEGRLDKDEAQVSASHLPEFEQALHRFLTNERGKAKLLGAAQQLEAHLHVGQGIIPERLALLSRGLEDLEARYLGKQEPLKRLEMARRLILARFVAFLKTVMMDPKKAPDIAEIRVGHPSPFLANGIVIIDTPGFDAPEAGHAEIAKHVVGFIADCAVVLTPSYSPASLKLVDFLNSYLGPYLHRCVYVVTMMDRLRGKDGDAVLSHVRRRLGDSLTLSGVQVQPVAAQIMLDRLCSSDTSASELVWAEQFREFERALDIRVKRERASAIAEKIARLQCEALGRVENHLKLAADRFDQ